jgi:hypothetical protein
MSNKLELGPHTMGGKALTILLTSKGRVGIYDGPNLLAYLDSDAPAVLAHFFSCEEMDKLIARDELVGDTE